LTTSKESIGDARIVKISVYIVRNAYCVTFPLYCYNLFTVDYNRYLGSGEISNMLGCYIYSNILFDLTSSSQRTQSVSVTKTIHGEIQRYSYVSHFNHNWNARTNFCKNPKYVISRKQSQWGSRCSLRQAGRRVSEQIWFAPISVRTPNRLARYPVKAPSYGLAH